jgi:hypothetical protein
MLVVPLLFLQRLACRACRPWYNYTQAAPGRPAFLGCPLLLLLPWQG